MPGVLRSWLKSVAAVLAVLLCGLSSGFGVEPVDWEDALAQYQQSRTEAQRIADWAVHQPPHSEAVRKRWDFLRLQHPNSREAAQVEVNRVGELVTANQWEEVVLRCGECLPRTAAFPSKVASLAAFLARATANPKLAPAKRVEAARMLVGVARHKSFSVQLCLNFLTQGASGLSPEEAYALGRQLEEACGTSPLMREFRWRLVEFLTKAAASPEAAVRAVEEFLSRYGAGSVEGEQAAAWLARQGSGAAAKAVVAGFNRTEKERADIRREAARVLGGALAAGDAGALDKALKGGVVLPEKQWADVLWSSLLGGREFAAAPLALKARMIEAALAGSVPGKVQELAIGTVLHHFSGEPAMFRVILPHVLANATDIQRASTLLTMLTRTARESGDAGFAREAYAVAAAVTEKLEVDDLRVEYLFDYAEHIWDTDLDAAKAALRTAASFWPRIAAAAEAGWVLDFLEGRRSQVQGALPRRSTPRPAAQLVEFASGAEGASAHKQRVREEAAGRWTLEPLDVKRNVLLGAEARDALGALHPEATDGKVDTAWLPGRLPAALRMKLAEAASVERVVVRFTDPVHCVLTLCDARGRALRRMERDWGFWEQFQNSQNWSALEETFTVLPADDVAFVEVQVLASTGEGGVREVECFSPQFPVSAVHAFSEVSVDAGQNAFKISLPAKPEAHTRLLLADREYTRGYPIHRWAAPWVRSRNPLLLRSVREHFAVEFWGRRAELRVQGSGGLRWNLDGMRQGEEAPVHAPGKGGREIAFAALGPGRHLLLLEETKLPAANNFGGWADMRFVGLQVEGEAGLVPVVRFVEEQGGRKTSAWQRVKEGGWMRLPGQGSGGRLRAIQPGVLFDNREVAAQACGSAGFPQLVVGNSRDATEMLPLAEESDPFPEDLEGVLSALKLREVVVTYPKTGTEAEYEVAKKIAARAGLYLAPDDVGLNLYSSPVLAVGTPLRHRYCRQLLATAGVWNSLRFLNNASGVVGIERDEQGAALNFHVTGETPAAVLAAAERVLSRLPAHEPVQPLRVFAARELESVYPWQLHAGRPAPAPQMVLGANDRRSVQFGVCAERDLEQIRFECGPLESSAGTLRGEVLIRRVGHYEWIPFFGDLRLPNHLLPVEGFGLPAASACGVWLTVVTRPEAVAGTYRGTVRVSGGGREVSFPLEVRVAPVKMPDFTKAATSSFAFVPYWFHPGSEPWRRAVETLAADEAQQGVNTLHPTMRYAVSEAKSSRPAQIGIGMRDAGPEQVQWRAFDAAENTPAAGESVFVRFEREVALCELALGLRPADRSAFRLAVWEEGKWREVGERSRVLTPVFQAHGRRVESSAEVIRFRATGAGDGVRGTVWRVSAQEPVAFSQRGCVAVARGDDRWPLAVDFAALEWELGLMEKAYAERGVVAPRFLCQMQPQALLQGAVKLFGNNQLREGDVAAWFSEQLVAHLESRDRRERFILKVGDEPSNLEQWAQSAQPYRDGGLRIMTCHNASYPDMGVGVGLLDPWCPNYEHEVWKPFFGERKKAGDKVWWYECGVPATRLTGTPADNLPFYWLTAKWNLDGALNYAALHANKGSSMPVMFRFEHGMDHRLTVDSGGNMIPTMRREWEGDGIRDLRLIEGIRAALKRLEARESRRAGELGLRLDALIESVVPYRYGYSQDPQEWVRAREVLYGMATELAPMW
jgi:hypothetical protein